MKRQRESAQKHGFFDQLQFSLPVRSHSLSSKRIQLFSELIKASGGLVVAPSEKSLIIVEEQGQAADLIRFRVQKSLKGGKYLSKNVLKAQYLTDCFKQKRQLPFNDYRVFFEQEGLMKQEQDQLQQQKSTVFKKLSSDKKLSQRKQHNPIIVQEGYLEKSQSEESINLDAPQLNQLKPQLDYDRRKRQEEYWNSKKDTFVCQKGSKGPALNQFICDQLSKLQKIYQTEKDKGRAIAYRKAVSAVRSLKIQIRDQEDIKQLPGIGPKIQKKIIQIVRTGKLQKLQKFQKLDKHKAVQQLTRVWGIGPATALQLFNKNINSIEDLRKNPEILNKNQQIGLKYLDQFEQRIPRTQVSDIEAAVKKIAVELNANITLVTCGSYRRGKQTCGDIDIIMTQKDGNFQKDYLLKLVKRLERQGLLTEHLSIPKGGTHQSMSYMGVAKLYHLHRRIDIKHYPIHQYAFAILYFTGSDMFNRSMRLFARKKGFSLSDHGMAPVQRRGGEAKWKGADIVCLSQQDVFKFLGLDYKRPQQRSV